MAKKLKPRSNKPNNEPRINRQPYTDNDSGGQISEHDYRPETGSQNVESVNDSNGVSDIAQQAKDNAGQAKWNEDGSGWMADKLETAGKQGVSNLIGGSEGGNESQSEQSDAVKSEDESDEESDDEFESDSDGQSETTADVGGQNSVDSNMASIDVDESEEEVGPTTVERIKGFAKNALTQNPVSRGTSFLVKAGMGLLTGAGLSTPIAGIALALVTTLTVTTIGVTGAAIVASNNVRLDETVFAVANCDDEDAAASKAAETAEGTDTFNDAQQLENVKKIYSVLKEYGLSDVEIAGAVANMQQESGINPKRIEAMNSANESTYTKANKKGSTVENLFGSWGSFVAAYGGGLNEAGYLHEGQHWMGVGLIQWTGGSNYSLWKWAKANNMDMWSLDTQLTALLTPESGPYADRLKVFVTKDNKTPESAAVNFLNFVEYEAGSFTPGDGTHAKAENRQKYAAAWYVKIKEMQVDKDYAKSILAKVTSSIKDASGKKVSSTKADADDCNDTFTTSYGGNGWQEKGGTYSGNTGGWQAWKYDQLPDELKQYAIDPRSVGMKWHSSEGWTIGAGNYISSNINDQCTTLSSALIGVLWQKDGKPLGMGAGLSGNGDQLVGQMVSTMGVKSRTEPVSGDLVSTGTYNHTQVVSHVFENGDILVVEQNVTGFSGQGNGESFSWSYQYVTKAKYEADKYTFASPESKGYTINPDAKSVK